MSRVDDSSSEVPFQAIDMHGRRLSLYDDAEIVDPPSPIPTPCRPVWEAFEALRKSRQV